MDSNRSMGLPLFALLPSPSLPPPVPFPLSLPCLTLFRNTARFAADYYRTLPWHYPSWIRYWYTSQLYSSLALSFFPSPCKNAVNPLIRLVITDVMLYSYWNRFLSQFQWPIKPTIALDSPRWYLTVMSHLLLHFILDTVSWTYDFAATGCKEVSLYSDFHA